MGIFDRLTTPATAASRSFSPNGSIYAPNYVVNNSLPKSPLSTKQSKLHADNNSAGYSTGDDNEINQEVFRQVQQYDDGHDFTLPNKEQLDYHIPKPSEIAYTILPTSTRITPIYNSENTYLNSFKPGSK